MTKPTEPQLKPGQTIYLRDKYGRCERLTYQGETSRSWICGGLLPWDQEKYAKREHTLVDEATFLEWRWARFNRYRISKLIDHCDDPAILRQVAALVGYEDGK